jgi:hypothetical protein
LKQDFQALASSMLVESSVRQAAADESLVNCTGIRSPETGAFIYYKDVASMIDTATNPFRSFNREYPVNDGLETYDD